MLNINGMNPIERIQSGLSKLTSRKSTKDMTALNSICNKDWPLDPNSYDLLDDCGRGVSATVGECTPTYSHQRLTQSPPINCMLHDGFS